MRPLLVFALLPALLVAGCLVQEEPDAATPDAETPETFAEFPLPGNITALDPLAALDLGGGGNGIWIDEERHLLFSTNGGAGFHIVDIQDPAHPVELGDVSEGYVRDVDIVRWQNRTYAVAADNAGIYVIDTTDPTAPNVIAYEDAYAAHNLAAVPGTPYVYASSGFLPNKWIPVLDITLPEDPQWSVIDIPAIMDNVPIQSDGCHDITVQAHLGRAYCAGGGSFYTAGGGESILLDISQDPLHPGFLGVVDNPSIMYHHQALASEDGRFLYINDEFLAPNCQGATLPMLGSRGQTTAAVWIYDISDPKNPELRSWIQPYASPPRVNCGSHFGNVIDGTSFLVWGWYEGGTVLIDVAEPDRPIVVDIYDPSGSTWDAHYFNGHVFSSAERLDVFRVV